jgi:predicted NUDIX family phosphoesterase
MERLARIRNAERQVVEQFLLIDDWRKRITGVVVMTTSPRDSMEREKGYLPVEGAKGSIMNEEVLEQMLETTRATADRLKNQFRVFEIDTSTGVSEGPQRTAERVAEIVLGLIEEQLEEEILFLPSKTVAELFGDATWLPMGGAEALLELFRTSGQFRGREAVESDESLVQALPVVVVRNRSGYVLRLKRKEQKPDNPLHEKLVIWAGGHVRREDGSNGASIRQCAVRELQEELRLSIDAKELKFLGAVRSLAPGKTRRHVAIVFEWRAGTDDVAVALSSAEFFERRGTSLSGSFVQVDELAKDIDSGRVSEPWSTEIVRHLLPDVNGRLAIPKLV